MKVYRIHPPTKKINLCARLWMGTPGGLWVCRAASGRSPTNTSATIVVITNTTTTTLRKSESDSVNREWRRRRGSWRSERNKWPATCAGQRSAKVSGRSRGRRVSSAVAARWKKELLNSQPLPLSARCCMDSVVSLASTALPANFSAWLSVSLFCPCLLIYLFIHLCTCVDAFRTNYLIASLLHQLASLYTTGESHGRPR